MQVFVNAAAENAANDKFQAARKEFEYEFAKGYLEVALDEKREEFHAYTLAYEEMTDKDSFKANYLKGLMDSLRAEIQAEEKMFQ